MDDSRRSAEVPEATFSLGWLKPSGQSREVVGSVMLPDRPTTLGEARQGLMMIGGDEKTSRWLATWAVALGEERSLLLQLPSGWFELRAATIAPVPGAPERFVVRFDRRSPDHGPDA
jgi:hypothetical protein